MLLYFVGPKHPSGNCYVSCFLTDKTALSVSTFLGFMPPPTFYVSMFYILKKSKNCHFEPPSPPISAYVTSEWSPT